MPRLRWTLLACLLLGALGFKIQGDLTPARKDVALAMDAPVLAGLRIAVLSDLHLGEDPAAFGRMAKVRAAVNVAKPDLIALLGDYTAHPGGINDVARLEASGHALCVRGIGDAFTGHHRKTRFPEGCEGRGQLTLTHDPFAAFALNLEGLVLAGHTHCGQVRMPGLGPLWVPSNAPRVATCGEYREGDLTLWVSAGLGTSLAPLRFWAPAQWDVVTIHQK